MFTYKFFINADRDNVLTLLITNNRKKATATLGYKFTPDALADIMSAKPSASNKKYRSVINHFIDVIEQVKTDLLVANNTDEDAKAIRDMIVATISGNVEKDKHIGEFITHYLQFVERKNTQGTKNVYNHTLSRIRAFDAQIDDKMFTDITLQWLNDFEAFCARTANKNARNIHLRNIRAVFNSAIDYELTTHYPFRRFKIRPEATRKRSLSVEDLRKLFNYEVEEYAVIYRDMFKLIFMLIGINVADLYYIKRITSDGRIEYKRAKTHRLYSIKVEPEAREIIEQYRGENYLLSLADNVAKHQYFTARCNKALKKFGTVKRVGRGGKKIFEPEFDEGISIYWARHSWATIASQLDIPKEVISAALGHGSVSVTDIYIDFDARKIDRANRMVLDYVLYDKREKW